ncbi:hypothetical protein [Phytohalomonas tamaricis]|uniref:hypothetical protein n=1 Tax=Phytohalomonas tamaricis TaxID=2081032 RepID=UPI000D0AFAD8|nr:hypothetical protein [Phytohalomonas tamaricis]
MSLTDYTTLCIDAHGVLIDRDSAILEGLAPLLSQLPEPPTPDRIMADYVQALHALVDEETGTVSAHCLVYREMAETWGLEPDWQAGIEFASTLGVGSLYEDAPGAIHYLRKFYQLRIVTSLDEREFAPFDQKIGLTPSERLTTGSFVAARTTLKQIAADASTLLLTAGPPPPTCRAGHYRITRATSQGSGDNPQSFITLSAFIGAHQLALRNEFL